MSRSIVWPVVLCLGVVVGAGVSEFTDKEQSVVACDQRASEMAQNARAGLRSTLGRSLVKALRGKFVMRAQRDEGGHTEMHIQNPLYENGVTEDGKCSRTFVAGLAFQKSAGRQVIAEVISLDLRGATASGVGPPQSFISDSGSFPPDTLEGRVNPGDRTPIIYTGPYRDGSLKPVIGDDGKPTAVGVVSYVMSGRP